MQLPAVLGDLSIVVDCQNLLGTWSPTPVRFYPLQPRPSVTSNILHQLLASVGSPTRSSGNTQCFRHRS